MYLYKNYDSHVNRENLIVIPSDVNIAKDSSGITVRAKYIIQTDNIVMIISANK